MDEKLKMAYRALFETQREEKFLRHLLILKEKEISQKKLRKKQRNACKKWQVE